GHTRCLSDWSSDVCSSDLGPEPPWLFVHGGGASGACFRETVDGRPGWADVLAAEGAECWVTDWPGCGRSGGRDPLAVRYADLVEDRKSVVEGKSADRRGAR